MKIDLNKIIFGSFITIICAYAQTSQAQVAISVGAQSFYDDNIFLENGQQRPAPTTFNSELQTIIPSGYTSLENFDGEEDSDIITNVFTQFSGKLPFLRKTFNSEYNLRLGAIVFADFNSQDRFTVDGQLTNSLSDNILPKPYYLDISNAIQSNSNNLAAASGTASQSTQNYLLSAGTGIRGHELTRDTKFDLGYTGTYQLFLGQFYLNKDLSTANTEQQGTDSHSHTAQTSIRNQVTKSLEIGALGSGGVQLFTKIHNGSLTSTTQEPEDLDRTNAQLLGTSKYTLTKTLDFQANAGLAFSKLNNEPEPETVTTVDENGNPQQTQIDPDNSNTGFTYTASTNYAYRPGALVTIGTTQGFTTDLNGQRLLTRLVYANLIESITDDLQLTIGTRLVQLEDESDTNADTSRFEGTVSFNYHLSQNLSLSCGYNYADQSADDSTLQESLRYGSPEYTSNRFFIGITSGFIGLPL